MIIVVCWQTDWDWCREEWSGELIVRLSVRIVYTHAWHAATYGKVYTHNCGSMYVWRTSKERNQVCKA